MRGREEAIATAARAAGRDDLICVTGSFHLVGEVRKLLQAKGIEPEQRGG